MRRVHLGRRLRIWRPRPLPTTASWILTLLACAAVYGALVLPTDIRDLDAGSLARIPVEGLVVVALALVLRRRPMRAVAIAFGLLLGLLVVLKVLDMGFNAVFERPFDVVNDWPYLDSAFGVLQDSVGRGRAVATVVAAAVGALAVLTLLPAAVVRLTRLAGRRRRTSGPVLGALGLAWLLCALVGLQLAPVGRVASASTSALAAGEVGQLRADIADRKVFAKQIATDRFRGVPAGRLLAGLRGKDVLLVFVESYGQVALEDPGLSPGVEAVLGAGTRQLRAAGYFSRSAFLTSPTFGGASWLAHSTMQSGLWVDSQQRYDQLLSTKRLTLTRAFSRAGWRTVFDVPAITHTWPEGAPFYDFDKLYDAHDVGYRGPAFSYATMPDQYTLAYFRRHELAPTDRRPLMAEIDLVSSHHPWAPLPHLVPWDRVGDGSVFDGMPEQGDSPDEVFRSSEDVRAHYARSIRYTMRTLVSFLRTTHDPDLVMVVLGDHQPHTYVTGPGVTHDVPVSVIARDPAVMRAISGWGWQPGLEPSPQAPVWRMSAFRNRFFTAFSNGGEPTSAPARSER